MPPTPRRLGAGPGIGAVTVAHTAQLDSATLESAWLLVRDAFQPGGFVEQDWEHALGGMHALVHDGGELVAHGAVVQRRMLVGGRARRVGYVEAVAVAAGARRRGHGGAVMAALERVIRAAYDFGALSATDDGAQLYRARGWQLWQGPAAVLSPDGVVPTPDEDGAVYVLPTGEPLELTGQLTCDWRDGDLW
jgi:aminoglycoside 2'-N-acetyltransferase I